MDLPKCSLCGLKGIVNYMEYDKMEGSTKWFVCYKHPTPYYAMRRKNPQRTLDQWK